MKKLAIVFAVLMIVCLSVSAFADTRVITYDDATGGQSATLYSAYSVSAAATGLTSAITGTVGAAVTSGPTLTIDKAGTYELFSNVTTTMAAATFSAAQSSSCWLYRTNNTPGVVANSTVNVVLPTMTTLSIGGPSFIIAPVPYTTTNTDDTLQVYCAIGANPGAGAFNVTGIKMLGVRYR